MDHRYPPLSVRLVAGFLMLLTVWDLLGLVAVGLHGVPAHVLVARVVLTAVTAVGAWLLLQGIAWGYIVALGVGFYWLYEAAKLYPSVAAHEDITYTIAMVVYLAFGGLVLAGLLPPSALRWFARSRVDVPKAPTAN